MSQEEQTRTHNKLSGRRFPQTRRVPSRVLRGGSMADKAVPGSGTAFTASLSSKLLPRCFLVPRGVLHISFYFGFKDLFIYFKE